MISWLNNKGQRAEKWALRYLKRQGLQFIAKNYSHVPLGEIDLIMSDNNTVVFVEVRYRKSSSYGTPIETVTLQKQRRLLNTAHHYMLRQKWLGKLLYRFDLVGIDGNHQITWIKNAIEVEY